MLKQTLVLFLVAILVPVTFGYGSGAPSTACESLLPGHGVSKQTSDSPYSIGLTVSEYTPGTKVAVTINGGDFQGILLQARKSDGSSTAPVGTFSDTPANTKLTQCTAADDSLTHASTANKNGITVQWNPPSETVGDVKFYATVAQSKNVFWMDIESGALTFIEGGGNDNPTSAPSDSPNPTVDDTDQPPSAGTSEKSEMLLTVLTVLCAFLGKLY